MDHLVNPAKQAETIALLVRLLDHPGSVKELAHALRQLAFALETVAGASCSPRQRTPISSYQI